MAGKQQGWFRDPFGLHEERYFSAGRPTKLVRDGQVESYDEPPSTTDERDAAVAGEGGTTSSEVLDPNAMLIVIVAEYEALLGSRGVLTAAGLLSAVASVAPLLVGTVCDATQEAVEGLLDNGVPDAALTGNQLAVKPQSADDVKAALKMAGQAMATRKRSPGTQATPAHLLAGLVAAADSSAVRMLTAARIDLNLARRRAGLLLDSLQGPPAVTSQARPEPRKRLSGRRSQQAAASDAAAVSGYAAYSGAVADATKALESHDYQAASETWLRLHGQYRLEPLPRLEVAGILFQLGRADEATACLRGIWSSRRNGWPQAMASNCLAWHSVVGELVAGGAVSPAILHDADQAMETARAWRVLVPGSVDTVALIRTLQGRPADAVALLSTRLARTMEPGDATAREETNLALEEINCALAHRALGHTEEAFRLLASSRGRRIHPQLGPLNIRYLQWAGRAVELGQVPGA